MNCNKIITTAIAAGMWLCAQAQLVTYPAGEGVETIGDYAVAVRQNGGQWQPVAVYPVKVARTENARTVAETASMAYFDFDGTVEVKVTPKTGINEARIRPLSYEITPDVSDGSLTFTLDRPSNLSVEVNGDIFHNLHLFANPLDSNRPSVKELRKAAGSYKNYSKKGGNLLYFGPGVHRLAGDTLRIASNTTVYVDGGARVCGTLIADGVENVKFFGRGEIHPSGRGEGIYVKRSRNVEADGVIVTQIPVGGSNSVRINNVKSISSYGWGDGMNVFASDSVSYNRVFCRNSDDCNTVYATRKGFRGGCRNIRMENSTLWADVAHPIMIGLHGAATEVGTDAPADTIADLTYRNIDILDQHEQQIDYQGCMAINCGDNNYVRDVTFDNIRVEDIRRGQLVNIRIFFNKKYCKAPGNNVSNILFKDVTYNGSNAELSLICGYNENRTVSDITFDNLRINGVHIADDMPEKPKWYKAGDFARIFIGEHVHNVVFK